MVFAELRKGGTKVETRLFSEGNDLAKLPYFEIRDGNRLAMADDTVGPVIDVHTHFALSYASPWKVNIHKEGPPTEHYLPMQGTPIDMEVYLNKNFTPERLKVMKKDLTLKGMTPFGIRSTHTVPNLIREMDELGIEKSLILPIDYPWLSTNAVDTLRSVEDTDRFILFGSVHPYASHVEVRLDQQVVLGAKGIKVHPATQLIRPDNHRAMKLYRLCAERNLPILWHCGPVGIEPKLGRKLSQVVYYEKAIAENPDVIFVLGHSGALQMEGALGYAKRYPNVYMDLSCQSLTNLRTILNEGPQDRLMYGTDWPFYHQAIALAKILLATEDDKDLRSKVLYGNAARLFT